MTIPRRVGLAVGLAVVALLGLLALGHDLYPIATIQLVQSTSGSGPGIGPFFPWSAGLDSTQQLRVGAFFALLGVVGALVTVYVFLGEFLPSMGGKATYEELRTELETYRSLRDRSLASRERLVRGEVQSPIQDGLAAEERLSIDYQNLVAFLEKRVSRERWRLFLIGFPLYVILGGFFAVAVAQTPLQALGVGFGWTVVSDRFGLKRELAARRDIREKAVVAVVDQKRQAEKDAAVARVEAELARLQRDQAVGNAISALEKLAKPTGEG